MRFSIGWCPTGHLDRLGRSSVKYTSARARSGGVSLQYLDRGSSPAPWGLQEPHPGTANASHHRHLCTGTVTGDARGHPSRAALPGAPPDRPRDRGVRRLRRRCRR